MNQREIKFRAWDKTSQRMISEVAVTRDGYCAVSPELDRFILMQFTGLKDKNGNDIYEGDIVRLKNNICYVEWRDCCFSLRRDKLNGDPSEYNGNLKGYCDGLWGGPPEVIGNRLENPELLDIK